MIGKQIGQYEVIDIVGQGGMATVYKAYQQSFDRYVAIKVMPRQLLEDPTFLRRFQREARVIARLEHRSILPVYDYGEHEGVPYIVMRLVEAGTLRKKMFYEKLDPPTAIKIVGQVAEALDYAHSNGVVHRDLKPSNVLLDQNDDSYLTDFGIAKMLGSTSQVTGSGVVGTPNYMSPEQCQGKSVKPASDIYALGAILYEIVTGKAPFDADTPLAVMYMHVKDPAPSALALNPELHPDIDQVIGRAMEKRPGDRYPTASALAEDYRRVMQGEALVEVRKREYVATQKLPAEPTPAPSPTPGIGPTVVDTPGAPVISPPPQPQLAAPPPRRRRRGLPTGVLALLAGLMGIAVLVAIVGAGMIGISWLRDRDAIGIAPPPSNTNTPGGEPPPTAEDATEGDSAASEATTPPLIEGTSIGGEPTATSVETPEDEPTDIPPTPTTEPPTATTVPPTDTPVIRPSGRIVYMQGFRNAAEIVVIDADGTGRRQLTNNSVYDGEPDWSPDGSQIAFESERGDNRDIYIMNADGSNVRQLTSYSREDRNPDWSPDGSLIVYEGREADNEDSSEIYVIEVSTGARTRLTDNAFGDRAPQFSPDGTRIAYMTNSRGKWQIAIMSYPGGVSQGIFDCSAPNCRFPTWSPDGAQVAFNTLDSNGTEDEIWLLNVTNGSISVLVQGQDNGRPVWSDDGRYLYFNRTVGDETDIYRLDLQTGLMVEVTTTTTTDYAPDWGP